MPSVNRIIFFNFKNHPAERKWVEFNTRVNYPIKRALNTMVNEDLINMDDDMNKFCVSWFTSRTADIGIKRVISSWNNHPIPGKCLLWWFGVQTKGMESQYIPVLVVYQSRYSPPPPHTPHIHKIVYEKIATLASRKEEFRSYYQVIQVLKIVLHNQY